MKTSPAELTPKVKSHRFWATVVASCLLAACGGQTGSSGASSSASTSSASSSSASSTTSSSSSASSSASGQPSETSLILDIAPATACLSEGAIETEHGDYNGAGYLNGDNAQGALIAWHITTTNPTSVEFAIRYANGTTDSRPAEISINGELQAGVNFDPTPDWTSWQTERTNMTFRHGSNVITVKALETTGLPNIDQITITGAELTEGNCAAATPTVTPALLTTGAPARFSAESYRGGAFINALDWEFGDGATGTGEEVQHIYAQSGTYKVTLTATDTLGEQTSIVHSVQVSDLPAPTTVFIAGDSTVSNYPDTASPNDQAGWGQMLPEQFTSSVTVDNRAIGGRSSRRFIDEGRLDAIWNDIQRGDYLLVQFGTNDGHKTATYTLNGNTIPYYLDPATDFKFWLQKYVDGANARDVHLVFVTPPPRNSAYCTGGNGTGAHASAMRELAADNGIPLVDLNAKVVNYLMAICPAPSPETFFFVRADGSVDGTHFQEQGARIMSGMVIDGLGEANVPLSLLRKSF